MLRDCKAQEKDVLEVDITKGIVLKHAGDLLGSAAACYTAQSLDTADRSDLRVLKTSFQHFAVLTL